MLSGHPSAKLGSYHVAYSIGLPTRCRDHRPVHPRDVRFDARVGAAQRRVVRAVNLVAVIVLARLCAKRLRIIVVFLRSAGERRDRVAPALRQGSQVPVAV